jgi:ABC-type nickel/cobalt efflux system permease component RcnA
MIGLALAATLMAPLAHPMGNFSVNQFHEIVLGPDRVEALVVIDSAEIPTLSAQSSVDTNGDGAVGDAERAAHSARACSEAAGGLTVTVGGDSLLWTVATSAFEYGAGAGALPTSRLECSLVSRADLRGSATVTVENRYLADQLGWREMIATASGVRLASSSVPTTSVTDRLRSYQDDVLSSALDVRSAVLDIEPGTGVAAAPAATPSGTDPVSTLVAAAQRRLEALVGGQLNAPVALLAVFLALLLGAAHAALPGHGKTVMAAYLAGTRGRRRDAVAVGAAVTVSHTVGVLVIGGLLAAGTAVIGEGVMRAMSLISAALVVAVGLGMLLSARRRGHGHSHDHDRHHDHHRGHDHHGPNDHHHDHHGPDHHHHGRGHGHSHSVRTGRWGLAGIGLAGGLVPSPSALILLLAAVGLGRTAFGIVLVMVYGLGMAATLTGAGLLLVGVRHRLASRRWPAALSQWAGRSSTALPMVTAAMIVVVGLGLAFRAAGGVV